MKEYKVVNLSTTQIYDGAIERFSDMVTSCLNEGYEIAGPMIVHYERSRCTILMQPLVRTVDNSAGKDFN